MAGISEIIEHSKNGFLVEARNVMRLQKAILVLIEKPDMLQTLSGNARMPSSVEASVERLPGLYTEWPPSGQPI